LEEGVWGRNLAKVSPQLARPKIPDPGNLRAQRDDQLPA